ncbi:hypothetical protein KR018_009165 [Drosophila ironensis]|nr:hypothetical protein KR018_009165 [Drosophila ironensis]
MIRMSRKKSLDQGMKMLSQEESSEKQKKFLSRVQDVVATCGVYNHELSKYKVLEKERLKQDSWERYLQCNNLPNPDDPVQARTLLAKIRHFEEVEVNNAIDWKLSINERSILSQNIHEKDMTEKALQIRVTDKPEILFENNINNCLETIRLIDLLMDNEAQLEELELPKRIEIMKVYDEFQMEIQLLFDRLTYRLLRMQRAYMNVPVMMAEFHESGVDVQLPVSVLTDCVTIRCIHTEFDHYSQNVDSLESSEIDNEYMPSSGLMEMEASMVSDWIFQMDIQNEIIETMSQKRREYEEMLVLIAERTDQAAKAAKNEGAPKVVIPKTPKFVPEVPPGMYPDVEQEFLKREEIEYKTFMDNAMNPKYKAMIPDEINLREYIIVGGVYSIMFVRRPNQTKFEKFSIVLHEDGRTLKILSDKLPETQGQRKKSVISEIARTSSRYSLLKLEDDAVSWFHVTLRLPPDLCRWGVPKVCHLASGTHRIVVKKKPARLPSFDLGRISSFVMNPDLGERAASLSDRAPSFSERASSLMNYFSSTGKAFLRRSTLLQRTSLTKRETDFELDKKLNKVEIMNLQRFCVPRIISSFKMPHDFNDAKDMDAHGKSRHLVRRFDATDVQEETPVLDNYSYEVQQQPERMFPHFQNVVPIFFDSGNIPFGADVKKTACGLLETFDTIKEKYLANPMHIMRQVGPPTKHSKKDKIEIKEIEVENRKSVDTKSQRYSETESSDWDFTDTISMSSRPSRRRSVRMSTTKEIEKTKKKRKTKMDSHFEAHQDDEEGQVVTKTCQYWTVKHIRDLEFNGQTNTITFKTDRLGVFGLAFDRYEHFPFRNWIMQPNQQNPDEICFDLDTFHVRLCLFISAQGVRGYVTDITSGYTAKPVKYLEIKEPISDYRELRRIFQEKNLNIFAQNDANFYIKNGYFSIKHVATECHIYNIMALNCRSMKFQRSSWNRLAVRRDILMDMKIAKDISDFSEVTVRMTPERTSFVKVSERCSDQIDVIQLEYTETWRNVNNYTDLNQAILSINLHGADEYNKDPMLFVAIQKLLREIRPLSYS